MSTVPHRVTAATPLDALALDWSEGDLPQRERTKHVHGLHPYLGKFVPQLAEVFLRKYFVPGNVVVDPFCGSGTALVEAQVLGIHALGTDISAFNVLLARVKTRVYDLALVEVEAHRCLEWASRDAGQLQPSADAALSENVYLRRWLAPQALRELWAYRQWSECFASADVLRLILCRPFLRRYTADTLARLQAYAQAREGSRDPHGHLASGIVGHVDARMAYFDWAGPTADGVLTSPPYVGLIDYHEQHRCAYELLGLEDRRADEIGPAAAGSGKAARAAYAAGMVAAFANVLRGLRPGAPLVVVAHDRHGLYPGIAAALGVTVEGTVERMVGRRTGRRAGVLTETIFVWRKP